MSNTTRTFVFPFPPTANMHWRTHKNAAHCYLSRRGRWYRAEVAAIVGRSPYDEPIYPKGSLLVVKAVFTPPDRRKRDVDNLWKALMDSMQEAGVWEDDTSVKDHRGHMELTPSKPGSALVHVRQVTEKELDGLREKLRREIENG